MRSQCPPQLEILSRWASFFPSIHILKEAQAPEIMNISKQPESEQRPEMSNTPVVLWLSAVPVTVWLG